MTNKLPLYMIRGKFPGGTDGLTVVGCMGGVTAAHAIERHKAWAKEEGLVFEYAAATSMPGEFEYL